MDAAAPVEPIRCSYLVPIRWADGTDRDDLAAHLARIAATGAEVIVVDGSEPSVFAADREAFAPHVAAHLAPDLDLRFRNGKVAGVITAARRASHEALVIADDDVRYDLATLARIVTLLADHDLVRPQNYFRPLPWHARWDTARTLLNRAFGRDYPGTLAVRRSRLQETGGYDGDVLFENLELIRTVEALGGSTTAPLDLYVRRLPPSAQHFWGQRTRQAYDDFAIPPRMAVWLLIVPMLAALLASRRWAALAAAAAGASGLAERGRRRAGGARVFPASASVLAPLWVAERGVCSWLAVLQRVRFGGVRYGEEIIPLAAHSTSYLRSRHGQRASKRQEPSSRPRV
jgi:hypothetical protein